jgi:hypothetical protein
MRMWMKMRRMRRGVGHDSTRPCEAQPSLVSSSAQPDLLYFVLIGQQRARTHSPHPHLSSLAWPPVLFQCLSIKYKSPSCVCIARLMFKRNVETKRH